MIVALGSNLGGDYGNPETALNYALSGFPEIGLIVKAKSSFWRSAAWPDPAQPPYLNSVAIVETTMTPEAVLRALHGLEARFGRRRGAVNAARVLDLDLIAYGRLIVATDEMRLPHPRAAERRFVMAPLAEIAPDWRHPVSGLSAQAMAQTAPVGRDAAPMMKE